MPGFRFEVTRKDYTERPADLFAGHDLRLIAERECDPFVIRWRDEMLDVLVVEGEGPTEVVTALQAFVMGHNWRAALERSI